jgi:hypothetical protein
VKQLIVAIDFDGTCVDHRYPEIGPDAPGAVATLLDLVAPDGDDLPAKLILWTMRSGDKLAAAREWFSIRGIPLFGVNENPEQRTWSDSPKAYAQVYIDDAALGCPLVHPAEFSRPCVDWARVRVALSLPVPA